MLATALNLTLLCDIRLILRAIKTGSDQKHIPLLSLLAVICKTGCRKGFISSMHTPTSTNNIPLHCEVKKVFWVVQNFYFNKTRWATAGFGRMQKAWVLIFVLPPSYCCWNFDLFWSWCANKYNVKAQRSLLAKLHPSLTVKKSKSTTNQSRRLHQKSSRKESHSIHVRSRILLSARWSSAGTAKQTRNHSTRKHPLAEKCYILASHVSSVSAARNIYTIYDYTLQFFQRHYV